MLIIPRNKDQSFYIEDNVKVTILDVDRDTVCFKIKAPRHVQVDREEIYLRKKLEQKARNRELQKKELGLVEESQLSQTKVSYKKKRQLDSRKLGTKV